MKLSSSFIKELKIASRGFYFYIEIFMAIIILAVLLFAVPENFGGKTSEYLYLNIPDEAAKNMIIEMEKSDIDGKSELVEIKSGGELKSARLFETETNKVYLVNDEPTLLALADKEKTVGVVVEIQDNDFYYKYYLQGYESDRLKNVFLLFQNKNFNAVKELIDNQDVRPISEDYDVLSDREHVVPSVLTFNGSLMGFFIVAAFVFLDKQEGVIKALAVTPSPVWQYLLSKVFVLVVVSIISSLIVVVPLIGLNANYLLLLLFLITTAFFASSLGLLITSFFKTMMQAFGVLYLLIVILMLPNIAYFIPTWEPSWIKILPTYPILEGFKEIFLKNGDTSYVLLASLGFFIVGLVLFFIASIRFKKTLTV